MQGKLRNSELTKQTVDRKQKFTPIPFVDKLSLCVTESYYDCQRYSRSLGAEKWPYIYINAWYPGLTLKKQDALCMCMKRMGLKTFET